MLPCPVSNKQVCYGVCVNVYALFHAHHIYTFHSGTSLYMHFFIRVATFEHGSYWLLLDITVIPHASTGVQSYVYLTDCSYCALTSYSDIVDDVLASGASEATCDCRDCRCSCHNTHKHVWSKGRNPCAGGKNSLCVVNSIAIQMPF